MLSRESLRNLIATQPSLSDTILKALMARRILLLTSAAESLRLVGSRFSRETRRIREFLVRSHIPHEWLDRDRDAAARELLETANIGPSDLPVVFWVDETSWSAVGEGSAAVRSVHQYLAFEA